MSSQSKTKPWSVNYFEEQRPHMTEFVRNEISPLLNMTPFQIRRLLVHGQVKVGKREIVEYIAMRDHNNPTRLHIFISSFHRKADESQRTELQQHDIIVFSVYSKKKQEEAIQFIESHLLPNVTIVIHWDECDYGTGERQALAKVYEAYREHPQVFNILYSATPEELLYSSEIAVEQTPEQNFIADFYEDGIVKRYIPPMGYCGAVKFLEENLVHDALPFFDVNSTNMTLSTQGKTIVASANNQLRMINKSLRRIDEDIEEAEECGDYNLVEELLKKRRLISVRNIIVLRISYKNGDDNDDDDSDYGDESISQSQKAIYQFLKMSQFVPELASERVAIYADKHDVKELIALPNITCETVQWGKRIYWENMPKDKVIIVVHDQTSTRSTEWVFHDRLFATHDYRKRITFNTVCQAQLRPAHYEQNYGDKFQPIHIYGHSKTFRFCAGEINAVDYLNSDWIVRKIPKSEPARYRLKNVLDARQVLPNHLGGEIPNPLGYTAEDAQKLLIQLGCTNNGDTKMSQRVTGKSKKVPDIFAKFYPCDPVNTIVVLDQIYIDPEMSNLLNGHRFTAANLFKKKRDDGLWCGQHRGWDVFQYEQLKHSAWGIRFGAEKARITVCYKNGELGLIVRAATGEIKEINDLEAYKSMYQ
jgi:hypothetical protein